MWNAPTIALNVVSRPTSGPDTLFSNASLSGIDTANATLKPESRIAISIRYPVISCMISITVLISGPVCSYGVSSCRMEKEFRSTPRAPTCVKMSVDCVKCAKQAV